MGLNLKRWSGNFLSTQGRITAAEWRAGMLVLFLASLCARWAIGHIVPGSKLQQTMFAYAYDILLLYPFICLSAQRFNDRGEPGAFALFVAVPSALTLMLSTFPPFPGSLMLGTFLGGITIGGFAWFIFELGFGRSRVELAIPRASSHEADTGSWRR